MNQLVAQPSKLDEYRTAVLPPERARDLYSSLPGHIKPAVFERNLVNALMANPALMDYDARLIFREVSKAAGLGLLLDPLLGEAYIVTAYNYKSKRTEPQLRVGYKGMCKLARQAGNVSGIYAHEVHAFDEVECDLGFPKVFHHRPKLFSDRGELIGYVATVTFKDGTFDFEPMSVQQCQGIRDRSDAWKAFKDGKIKSTPWSTDEVEMSKKTTLRRLMKRQEQSPELAEAIRIEDEAEHPEMRMIPDVPRPRVPSPSEMIEAPRETPATIDEAIERRMDDARHDDPITSGPEKPGGELSGDPVDDLAETGADAPAATPAPQEPHLIVGDHYTAKTWSEAYIAAMQTSIDTAMIFKWIDANAVQLKKLSKTMFAKVETATEAHRVKLREGAQVMPDIATDYESWIKWAIAKVSATDAGDDMDALFESLDGFWADLFPGDKELLLSARRGREESLEQ